MDKSINKAINSFLVKAAELNPKIITAYLFGSFAKEKENTDSDIDIALIIDGLKDDERFDLQVRLMLLAAQFDSRIEPHPLSENDFISINPFTSEIKKTGIEINPLSLIV